MICDQVFYTSSTTGIRGGAGFQINAHSGSLEPDILRELEAYSLYIPPANCPRTPETPEEFANFPVSYRYRRFGGRRPGISRSQYLGKDYNSVRYGNFFTHIILAIDNADIKELQDPIRMGKLSIWAAKASQTTELPSLDIEISAETTEVTIQRDLLAHPRFQDLISFSLSGLADRKTTIIVDTQENTAKWISAVLSVLPSGIRSRISFSTYEYNPQNLDYSLCGTTQDSGFDFSEANFKFNYNILDFESSRFSPSPETGYFANLTGKLGAAGDIVRLQSFLTFINSIKNDPETAELNSLAELWSILNEKDQSTQLLRAMQLMKEFSYKPSEEESLRMRDWVLLSPLLSGSELQSLWSYWVDFLIKSETSSPRILSWAYTLLIVLVKNHPNGDNGNILRLGTLIQHHGGLLKIDSYDKLVLEIKNQLTKVDADRFLLLKLCREIFLTEHPELRPHLQSALIELIQQRTLDEAGFEFLASSLAEQVPYVENVILDLFSVDSPQRWLVHFLVKLISKPEAKSALQSMLSSKARNDVWELIELYELFSIDKWEESASRWWMVNRLATSKQHLQNKFWSVAQMVHPSWAPQEFLIKDPALIRYPSFINAFWHNFSSFNSISSYDKKTTGLLDSLENWFNTADQGGDLKKETLDVFTFIGCYRTIFYGNEPSPLETVKRLLYSIPSEYSQYRDNLGTQLIRKLNSPSRKSSDWESLLSVIHTVAPKAIPSLIEKERSLLQDYPAVFWVGLVRLAVSAGTLIPVDLHRLLKQSIKELPETKLTEITEKVRDKPALGEYIQAANQASFFKRVLGVFRK